MEKRGIPDTSDQFCHGCYESHCIRDRPETKRVGQPDHKTVNVTTKPEDINARKKGRCATPLTKESSVAELVYTVAAAYTDIIGTVQNCRYIRIFDISGRCFFCRKCSILGHFVGISDVGMSGGNCTANWNDRNITAILMHQFWWCHQDKGDLNAVQPSFSEVISTKYVT